MKQPHPTGRRIARRGLQVVALFVAVHFLLPVLGGFRSAATVVESGRLPVLAGAVAVQLGSLLAYAQCARVLLPSGDRPGLLRLVRLQLAMLATSHVVPGGAASSTPVGYRLFRRAGVSAGDAGFVLGIQGVGSAAVLNGLFVLVLLGSAPLRGLPRTYLPAIAWAVLLISGLVVVVGSLSRESPRLDRGRRALAGWVPRTYRAPLRRVRADLVADLQRLRAERRTAVHAVGWAAAQWILDCASLWVALAAFGAYLPPDTLFVAFALAQLASFVPITPAGLGLVEGALTSGLVGLGVPGSTAVVAVLAYRLIEFWLPIPLGALALVTFGADLPPLGPSQAAARAVDGG